MSDMRCDCTGDDSALHPEERGTRFILGAPYHWTRRGHWLSLHKGYAPGDPARATAEATQAYRDWMSR